MLIFIIIFILGIIQAVRYKKKREYSEVASSTKTASPFLVGLVFFLVGSVLAIVVPLSLSGMDLSGSDVGAAIFILILVHIPVFALSYMATIPFFKKLESREEKPEE